MECDILASECLHREVHSLACQRLSMHFFSKRKSKSCKLLCSAVRGLLLEPSCGCLILCIGSFLRPLVGTLSLSLSKVLVIYQGHFKPRELQPHRVGRAVRRPFIIDLQCKSPPKRRSHRSIGSELRAPSASCGPTSWPSSLGVGKTVRKFYSEVKS